MSYIFQFFFSINSKFSFLNSEILFPHVVQRRRVERHGQGPLPVSPAQAMLASWLTPTQAYAC